jgi:D-glycero-D-manno-heptose 1,7-bisphosphate phosphatase
LPGLFEQSGQRCGVPLKGVPTAGDSLRDLQAGAAAGCEPHLILTGKSAQYRGGGRPEGLPPGTQLHSDLSAFVDYILERSELAAPVAL